MSNKHPYATPETPPRLRLVVTALETRAPTGHVTRYEIEPTMLDLGSAHQRVATVEEQAIEIEDSDILSVDNVPPQFFRRAA